MKLLGAVIMILGILFAAWSGIYFCFIGGIVQLINAIKASPVNSLGVALGITRILCSGFVGWLTGIILVALGSVVYEN